MSHNVNLFHCLNCGRVEWHEPGDAAPSCCEATMTCAAQETVGDDADDFQDDAGEPYRARNERTMAGQAAA